MEKVYEYLMTEYHHDSQDMEQLYGQDYFDLISYLEHMEFDEAQIYKTIDDFMSDRIMNKRRRRAY